MSSINSLNCLVVSVGANSCRNTAVFCKICYLGFLFSAMLDDISSVVNKAQGLDSIFSCIFANTIDGMMTCLVNKKVASAGEKLVKLAGLLYVTREYYSLAFAFD